MLFSMNAKGKEKNLNFLNVIFPVCVWDRNLFFSRSNDSQS